jgi:hypothetical protein
MHLEFKNYFKYWGSISIVGGVLRSPYREKSQMQPNKGTCGRERTGESTETRLRFFRYRGMTMPCN